MWFEASRFERLGRRVTTAPRALLVALGALTAAASPGVIRSDLAAPPLSTPPAATSDSLETPDMLLVELVCDAGLWSEGCLANVAALADAASSRADLVASVDSLASRPRVVREDGQLVLQPLLSESGDAEAALRRLRARAAADRASVRGVASLNERAALLQVRLVPGAAPRDVHGLVESLRDRFDRPPAFRVAALSPKSRAHELALGARGDLARTAFVALGGLALLGTLAAGSVSLGLALAALAAAACVWCAAALALTREDLGAGAALTVSLVCASAASTGLALAQRVANERRAGRALEGAVARAFGATAAPLAAATLAALAACVGFALGARPSSRPLALTAACGVAAVLGSVGVGFPAFAVAFRPGGTGPLASLGAALDALLTRLDGALRAPRRLRRSLALLACGAAAAFGVRQLRGDASDAHLAPAPTPASDALTLLVRDFGGTSVVRVVIDSGEAGGAADPRFLERAQDLEEAAAAHAAVGSARSLLDAVVLPAMRAAHDDDAGFAVVPATRAEVESSYALLARFAPDVLRDGTDTERRHLALDLLVDARTPAVVTSLQRELEARAASAFGRPDTLRWVGGELAAAAESERLARAAPFAALLALSALAAVAAFALDSAVGGALAALPAASGVVFVLGAMGVFGLPLDSLTSALVAFACVAAAGPALLYLARVRELAEVGADLHVAVSVALRDVGRPIASGAFASVWFLALLASPLPPVREFGALAAASLLVAVAATLTVLPACVRTVRPGFLIARPATPATQTLSCVRGVEGGTEQ